jgi:hypothetical protein
MQRVPVAPRPGYAAKLEAQGLSFHGRDSYWREDACYRFKLTQIEEIQAATAELHEMCIAAAKRVIEARRLAQLEIPQTPAMAWLTHRLVVTRERFLLPTCLPLPLSLVFPECSSHAQIPVGTCDASSHGRRLPCRLLQLLHHRNIRPRAMTHARDTHRSQLSQGRRLVVDHDVEWQR